MRTKRVQHIAFCTVLAVALTTAVVSWDLFRAKAHRKAEGLLWARQVASQTEALALQARESGHRDPIGWAASQLTQGIEPRLVRVARANDLNLNPQSPEHFEFDRASGVFDYLKMIWPESSTGVRIQISLGYTGFFGATSPVGGDLLTFLICAAFFGITFLASGKWFGFDDARRIREFVFDWVRGAKSQLTQLGVHIREMVRQSQRLAVASGRSRNLVGELRGKIHSGLTQAHSARKSINDATAAVARAETLTQDMMTEVSRLGTPSDRFSQLTQEIQKCLAEMRTISQSNQEILANLEKKIEPWATDADLAFHAFDEIKEATDHLGRSIRSTTETLIGQARLIQSLHLGLREQPPASQPIQLPETADGSPSASPLTALPSQMPAPLMTMPNDETPDVSTLTNRTEIKKERRKVQLLKKIRGA